jgi:hypothetical protein
MHEVRRAIPIDTINVDNRNYESILACRIKKKKEKKKEQSCHRLPRYLGRIVRTLYLSGYLGLA